MRAAGLAADWAVYTDSADSCECVWTAAETGTVKQVVVRSTGITAHDVAQSAAGRAVGALTVQQVGPVWTHAPSANVHPRDSAGSARVGLAG